MNAQVTNLRFYETGDLTLRVNQRVYGDQFSSKTARYIYWQMDLNNLPLPEKVHMDFAAVYYGPDGSVINRQTSRFSDDEGGANSHYQWGIGEQQPGYWIQGEYWVELFVDGELVAAGGFQIVDRPIAATPRPTPTSAPTPAPTPTAIPRPTPTREPPQPQVSIPCPEAIPERSTSITGMGEGASMTMSPGTPFAGGNVEFVVTGLDSWDVVEVTFVEPSGREARWIGDDQYSRSWSTNYFLSDESGGTTWTRYGAQDQVGDWSVRIRIDDSLRIINYSYARFRLPRLVHIQLGVPLYGCRSDEAVIFFSDSVNFSVTVDMHERLSFAADLLEERLGIRTEALPVIYMLGNQSDFESAARASGNDPCWEAGFFRSYGELRGIFMQSDTQRTDLYHTLTHEYIHFLMDEVLQGVELPAWLNEGLADYYEFEVGLQGDLPDASYTRMLRSADRAREAADEDRLFRLSQLESQREWNRRPEARVSLQYAQSHMVVRYLIERYGDAAPLRIAEIIAAGNSVGDAVASVTGSSYGDFELAFIQWLKSWDEPARAAARPYLQALQEIDAEQRDLRAFRAEAIKEWGRSFNRVTAEQNASSVHRRATALTSRIGTLQTTPFVDDLHEAATAYFDVLEEWLKFDYEFMSTALESKRLAANALIPQVDYRRVDFSSQLDAALFIMNLYE